MWLAVRGRRRRAERLLRVATHTEGTQVRNVSLTAGLAISLVAALPAQTPQAPWRGAGPSPCVGSDGGVYKCAPAPRSIAVRAGRLFDSTTGQMLTRRVVLITGDRITEVGADGTVKIPSGAQVIDLNQAT